MRVLVTNAAGRLGQALAAELAPSHRLRLMACGTPLAPERLPDGAETVEGSLLDPDAVWKAVRGMDAVIHSCEFPVALPAGEGPERHLVDLATRGTHVLFRAAVEAGVRRLVYGSTLRIFGSYPDDVYISEDWEPRPTPDIDQMAPYLAERVCMEFARAHPVTVTVLRLGKLVLEAEVQGEPPDLMWLDIRDAARALGWALGREAGSEVWWTRRYALYHICAAIPNAKFLVEQAAAKGFRPAHNFLAWWPTSGAVNGGRS